MHSTEQSRNRLFYSFGKQKEEMFHNIFGKTSIFFISKSQSLKQNIIGKYPMKK